MKTIENPGADWPTQSHPTPSLPCRHRPARSANDAGVALIICLGLLSIMTLLAVTFSIAMRIERMASRNFAEGTRAKMLVQTAYVRAMSAIDDHMLGPPARVYPKWDATNSTGTLKADILTPDAWDVIPGGQLSNIAQSVANNIRWSYVNIGSPTTTGRVAYLIVNTSGLVDINEMGLWDRTWSTNILELDVKGAPDFNAGATRAAIVNERNQFGRYETIDEFEALSANLTAGQKTTTFQTFSFDPGRDWVFFREPFPAPSSPHTDIRTNWWTIPNGYWAARIDISRPPRALGTREAESYLGKKFNINSFFDLRFSNTVANARFNTSAYLSDSTFMQQYWTPLRDMIRLAIPAASVQRPDDVAWNIVNYLDPDRIAHGEDSLPWTHSEGGEAIPLINEIVVEQRDIPYSDTNMWGPNYIVHTEVWFPFAPVKVVPSDKFFIQVMLFNARETALTEMAVSNSTYLNTNYSFTVPIQNMEYGTTNEFKVFSTTNIFFISGSTNRYADIGGANRLYYLSRVFQEVNNRIVPVDEAMGYLRGDVNVGKRALLELNRAWGYGVNDPRSNGQVKYWKLNPGGGERWSNGADYDWRQHTLGNNFQGATNANVVNKPGLGSRPICDPYAGKGQGLPMYAKNGPMLNIGELGHIFQSNLDDEELNPDYWFWRNLSLMRANEGALLLDMMSVYSDREEQKGLIAINSRQTNTWQTLFYNLNIGITNTPGVPYYLVPPIKVNPLIQRMVAQNSTSNCVSFYDLFTTDDDDTGGGGNLATAFRNCAPASRSSDIYKEDAFRRICELVTFRQNIFTIVLAAQIVAPDDTDPEVDWPVISERRAIAQVYRDAYTGRRFIRSFKWLDE